MSKIIFKINGVQHEADGKYGPDVSLNEFIRTVADLRGTKVMCQEGGCGACIVSVRASLPPTNEARIFSVNSLHAVSRTQQGRQRESNVKKLRILILGSLDKDFADIYYSVAIKCLVSVFSCQGWEITTVEGIGNRTIGYHEIQSRLANFNGTQCGYCTPGWVMNMYRCRRIRSLYTSKNKQLSMEEIENSFAGNMCRCTGYRPIAEAFKSFATDADEFLLKKLRDIEDIGVFKTCGVKCNKVCKHKRKEVTSNLDIKNDWCFLEKDNNRMIAVEGSQHKWFKVYSLEDVFKAIAQCSDYKLIAGNTGQGVYHITDYPKNVIDIFNVSDIKGYIIDVNLIVGAGMPLSEMMEVFLKLSSENEDFAYLKEFYNHMDLVAHIPVRNIGTIGGNLYLKHTNNEFPSDLLLLFETVGAMITIATAPNKRETITLTDFLKLDMKNKIIMNVILPPLSRCCMVKTYKIMPRSQNAHAIINAGFLFKFKQDERILEKMSIVYGNVSPTFIHAVKTEQVLINKDPFTDDTLQLALKTLSIEVNPEEALPEPSPEYRKLLALALYYKAILTLCPDDKLNKTYRSGGQAIKRLISKGLQKYDTDKSVWPLNKPIPKIEALAQCSGEATFANDLPAQIDEVFGAFVTADVNAGSVIDGFDTTDAMKIPGVIAFYSAKDIPGVNSFTPINIPIITSVEEILCSSEVKFYGQAAGIIVANREKVANNAAKLIKINYKSISKKTPLLNIKDVLASSESQRINTDTIIEPTETGNDVKMVIKDELSYDTQYHYYMEPQTCVVKPSEDGFDVYASTQWIDLANVAIAECLKIPVNSVNVIVRRVGGGYGGKITRSTQIACAAALVSYLQGKSCRFVLPLQTNMKVVGKRAPTYCNLEVGVNQEGEIQYLKNKYYQDNGCSKNENTTFMTIGHMHNCYNSKRWNIEAYSVLTDTPSTTWCRAPASCEGIAMTEYIMERIAHDIGKDPLEVRLQNMAKEDNPIPDLIEEMKKNSDYDQRQHYIEDFNKNNRWRKRALKILPMTYDLFYLGPYNCIVSIYQADGTVAITHGGTEMGQGINTKTAQVCAYILGIPMEKIIVKPSSSLTSPNCMATGGSVGSECVAYATVKACEILNDRLNPIRKELNNATWEEIIKKAYQSGVNLQASYMFSAKEPVKSYLIYGVVVMEVEVDILSGNYDIIRVDLLEDTGRSLSPEIDVAQIEGAFVMGLGYWTSEKMEYDKSTGKLLTDRTWTYKPPGIKDIPADFRVYFRRNSDNKFGVLQSKATGEPALCLAAVVTHALREAVRFARLDAGYEDKWINIGNPCTTENVFMAVDHKLEHFKLT